jgi:hypothetical protein
MRKLRFYHSFIIQNCLPGSSESYKAMTTDFWSYSAAERVCFIISSISFKEHHSKEKPSLESTALYG